jgi:hypothetical protein
VGRNSSFKVIAESELTMKHKSILLEYESKASGKFQKVVTFTRDPKDKHKFEYGIKV